MAGQHTHDRITRADAEQREKQRFDEHRVFTQTDACREEEDDACDETVVQTWGCDAAMCVMHTRVDVDGWCWEDEEEETQDGEEDVPTSETWIHTFDDSNRHTRAHVHHIHTYHRCTTQRTAQDIRHTTHEHMRLTYHVQYVIGPAVKSLSSC